MDFDLDKLSLWIEMDMTIEGFERKLRGVGNNNLLTYTAKDREYSILMKGEKIADALEIAKIIWNNPKREIEAIKKYLMEYNNWPEDKIFEGLKHK